MRRSQNSWVRVEGPGLTALGGCCRGGAWTPRCTCPPGGRRRPRAGFRLEHTGVEDLADTLNGANQTRLGGVALELLPQTIDPDAQRLHVLSRLASPGVFEQVLMKECPARVGCKVIEELPLFWREDDRLTVDRYLAAVEIDSTGPSTRSARSSGWRHGRGKDRPGPAR